MSNMPNQATKNYSKKYNFSIGIIAPLLTILTILSPRPSKAFELNSFRSTINFTNKNVGANTPNFTIEGDEDLDSQRKHLLYELLSPGQNYPLLLDPISDSQQITNYISKGSANSPLTIEQSEAWNKKPRDGEGSITVDEIIEKTSAAILWNNVFLKDKVGDSYASNVSSFVNLDLKSDISGPYAAYAFLNLEGTIDLSQPDAWVVGALFGKVNDQLFQPIYFGFDGLRSGSRKDFLTVGRNTVSLDITSSNTFKTPPVATPLITGWLDKGSDIKIEATFSCVAYNGTCGYNSQSGVNLSQKEVPEPPQKEVPEPLTILGSVTALGLGTAFKKRYSKKLEKQIV